MKQYSLLTFLLIFISAPLFSQEPKSFKDTKKNRGYFNVTKLSYSKTTNLRRELFIPGEGNFFGDLDTDSANAWSFHTINGFFLSPSFSLGLGIGMEGHHNPDFNVFPLFLDARFYLSDDAETFYVYADVGPTLFGGDGSEFRKGAIFNFGIGYKFPLTENLLLISDVFYAHKTVSLTDEGIGTSDDVIKANGFGLSLGVIF